MVKRFNIDCISDLFLQRYWSCFFFIHFHWEFAFSKARDLIVIFLASEFGIILFTADVNLCNKSVKVWACMTLVNDSIFFPTSSVLSQAIKTAAHHKVSVLPSYRDFPFYISIISLSKKLILGYFHTSSSTILHNCLSLFFSPSPPLWTSPQDFWNQVSPVLSNNSILFQVDHKFSSYFTSSKCMPYETISSLNLLKFNIAAGV